mgnify:CR=1 FL=1
MDRQKLIDQIELYRSAYYQVVDAYVDAVILKMTAGDLHAYLKDEGERYLPLDSAARCKAIRPTAVVLPNGERVETPTWNEVAAELLKDCTADPQRHQLLIDLREHTAGNLRQLLPSSPDGLSAPVKISDDLYLENGPNTQVLLYDFSQKVLRRVGYDCGSVAVIYRDPSYEPDIHGPQPDEENVLSAGPTM